nr:MAK10-like protein [Tanacetum cinerariifolium]
MILENLHTKYICYRNTIELPIGKNVVPLQSNTIWLVQNECSFHGLRSEDPNQHLKEFLRIMDSLDLDESLSEARTCFKDLLQKVPHHGIDLWLQVQIFYDHVNPVTRRTINQSANGKLRDFNVDESWALLEDLALYNNESWNDPKDFAKPVKEITLPQDVSITSDRCLIELENQVQRLMEAYFVLTQPTQVNKITTSCEIYSGPHDTQYCIETPKQAFVKYTSLRRPCVEISNMTRDPFEGVVRFTNENDEVAYKMPHKIEQYNSFSNLEKEHTKSVYLRNEEDKRRGVEYVMSKILGFYKECLELGPEYVTGMEDKGEVT